jgi:hypothetical protein
MLSLAVVLGVASAGRAQETCIEQMKFPEVGRWAEYQALYNKKDPYTIRYAVVGSERREGKDLKWLAMKMDGMMLKMIRDQMEKQSFIGDVCKDVTLVGPESVTVPAGKFQTRHFRSDKNTSDSWLTLDIPFAMVKSVGKNYEMALRSYGDGAKSSITEKPQDMGGGPKK